MTSTAILESKTFLRSISHRRGCHAGVVGGMSQFLAAVVREDAPADIFLAVANGLVDLCGAQMALVYRATPEPGRTLNLVASRNADGTTLERLEVLDVEKDYLPAARAARTRGVHFIDVSQGLTLARRSGPRGVARIYPSTGVVVAFPLLAGERLIGAVSAAFSRPLTKEEMLDAIVWGIWSNDREGKEGWLRDEHGKPLGPMTYEAAMEVVRRHWALRSPVTNLRPKIMGEDRIGGDPGALRGQRTCDRTSWARTLGFPQYYGSNVT